MKIGRLDRVAKPGQDSRSIPGKDGERVKRLRETQRTRRYRRQLGCTVTSRITPCDLLKTLAVKHRVSVTERGAARYQAKSRPATDADMTPEARKHSAGRKQTCSTIRRDQHAARRRAVIRDPAPDRPLPAQVS